MKKTKKIAALLAAGYWLLRYFLELFQLVQPDKVRLLTWYVAVILQKHSWSL